ncbi:MAG TPA: RsmF rRNA methyltransferase first C-terminal domain-containing protein [Promineifilum sp.]
MKRPEPATGPPPEFLAKMKSLLPLEEYELFRAGFDQPSHVGLRVNTLKISVSDFISIAPFSLAPIGDWEPAAFTVTDDSRPGRHPYHDAGLYYLQEPSAMVASPLLDPRPAELTVDLAAAPGGKSTHLASLMAGKPDLSMSPLRRMLDQDGLLIANDVSSSRSRLLAENLARMGATGVLVTQSEPERVAAELGAVADAVLVDAPCSGEGMFRRRGEVEWSEAMVAACSRRQQHILSAAAELVSPGGRLVYSTCTFSPEENEQVIAEFLAAHADFGMKEPRRGYGFDKGRAEWSDATDDIAEQVSRAVRLWPYRFPGEGHFLALMNRQNGPIGDKVEWRPFGRRMPSAEENRLWRTFANGLIDLHPPEERLHVHRGRLYLLPKTAPDPGRVRIVRYGVWLGEFRPARFHPAHDLALALNAADVRRVVTLSSDDPRLAGYLAGSDIPADGSSSGHDGWTLLTIDGYGLGWAKRVGSTLKNHYPHALRRRGGHAP